MRGPKLLKRYLRETGQRPADLSREAGFDQAALSRWLKGERRPGIDNAQRLEKHTAGAVPAAEWAKAS